MASYDIVKDFMWTLIPKGSSLRDETPCIYARSIVTNQNVIEASYEPWVKAIAGSKSAKDFYKSMHKEKGTGTRWVFPFFNDELRGFSNAWESNYVNNIGGNQPENFGSEILQTIKSVGDAAILNVEQLKDYIKGGVGVLYEPPKYYQYATSDNALVVDFSLINTVDDSYNQNYEVVKELIKINRFDRTSGFATTPPVLWEIEVPGYRYIPWASCNVSISQVGTRRLKNGKIIPEGYKISLTFTSLYTEPGNLMEEKV